MDFKIFDESIGIDNYKKFIHKVIFPGPSKSALCDAIDGILFTDFGRPFPLSSFKITKFKAKSDTFPQGSAFSRVRIIKSNDVDKFMSEEVCKSEFYPPDPKLIMLKDGRYNDKNSRVMYLSDSPETAEIECNLKNGDYYLRSQFSLNSIMTFFTISEKSKITKPFIDLINNDDIRFYPVISYLMSQVIKFDNFHGCVYESIPARKNKSIKKSKTNLAIWGEYLNQVNFEFSFLCLKRNNTIHYLRLFYPTVTGNKIESCDYIKDPINTSKKFEEIYNNIIINRKKTDSITNEILEEFSRPLKIISR